MVRGPACAMIQVGDAGLTGRQNQCRDLDWRTNVGIRIQARKPMH